MESWSDWDTRGESLKVVLHAASVHHMSRATNRLQGTKEGVVAEGELVGAPCVTTLCVKEFGMVISPARLAVLVSHAVSPVARPWALALLVALQVSVQRPEASLGR